MQEPNNYIEAKDVLAATNGGLDIILELYPQAQASVEDKKRKFKLREEKSASANLYQSKEDGTWLVTDFGDDQKPRNGVGCWMAERNVDFPTALREIAGKWGIGGAKPLAEQIRAAYSEEPAQEDDQEGKWTWETRNSLTNFEIETIVSKNVLKELNWNSQLEHERTAAYSKIAAKFKYYRWHALISYTLIKNGKRMTFSATDEYPMFLIDEGNHQKFYQPKHPDKSMRFMYYGEKPKHFVHGLKQLEKAYNERKEEFEDDGADDDPKLDEVVLCSGGSDAINVALIGYQVIWLNSETEGLQYWHYKGENGISSKVKKFYQLQDIDFTGKAAAHKLALEYMDVYTIELPEELKMRRDQRGGSCKDVRDYFNHYKVFDFKKLVESALPYRFWERIPNYVGRGDNQVFVGYKYIYRSIQANNFLYKNGFGRMRIGDKESDWTYIECNGNVVREVDAGIIQDYLHEFLEKGYYDIELREAMINTSKLNETSLSRLKFMDINFTDFSPKSQFLFFRNKTVEVTPNKINFYNHGTVNRFIWKDELHAHSISPVKEPPFIITKDPNLGTYDIEIKDRDCPFLKYLIQTSRIHWRTEMEYGDKWRAMKPIEQDEYKEKFKFAIDGPNLSAEEIDEQKQHLLNKLFVIGWHLHAYKDPTKGWFSWGMDGKMSDDGKSHGGSGKSLMFDATLRLMMPKNVFINARDPKKVESEFKYDGMTEHTRYVLFEDCYEHFKVEQFYVDTNGDVEVNPKGKTKFTIKFSQGPKFAFTSNFMPRDQSPSTMRRILYYVCSDYYHEKGDNNEYLERRTPETDLGMKLFDGFDYDQWNSFYNLMLHAIQFFLTTEEKIRPAMENVTKRNLLSLMGVEFHNWANGYFSEDSGNVNRFIAREEPQKAWNSQNNYLTTPQLFKNKLAAFCRYYGYILDPKEYRGPKGNITKKMPVKTFKPGSGTWEAVEGVAKVPKEVFFIQTRDELPEDPMLGFPEVEDNLPF